MWTFWLKQVKSLFNLAESPILRFDTEKEQKKQWFPLSNKQPSLELYSSSSTLTSLSSASSTTSTSSQHFDRNNFKSKFKTNNKQISNFFRSNRHLFNKSVQQQHLNMKSKQLQIIETEEEFIEDDLLTINSETENNNVRIK